MKVPLSKPYQSKKIEDAVLDVIRSGKYIGGSEVENFEKEFADYLNVTHVVTANSATSVEMLILEVMNIGPGDEVLVPSHTAFPTIEPIFHVGAKPVFVDINDNYTMNIDDLESKINNKSKAIIPVHLYGHPAKMDKIIDISKKNNLKVIEDCAQAHDAKYSDKLVGTFGDAAYFSFFPSKNLGTIGDGGALATNNKELADRVKSLRDHGRASRYTNNYIGYNLRFDPIKAAALRVTLPLLPSFTESRRKNAKIYYEELKNVDLILPYETINAKAVYHLYVIRTANKNERDSLANYLKDNSIKTNIHYPIPCHKQPATIKEIGETSLSFTEKIVDEILSLPMYPDLTREEIKYICDNIKNFYKNR